MELTQRFRRHVAPFDVVSSLKFVAGTNYCPAIQTIESGGAYSVDRTVVPTIIVADVVATAPDNSGSVDSVVSPQVTNIKWMVQKGSEATGRDIQYHPEWGASDFTIGTTGAEKGRLTISKNVPAGTTWKIWMECDISDTRRGYNVPVHVVTDSVDLFTIANANDAYTMSIDRPSAEVYEPALDRFLLYEYKKSIGEDVSGFEDGSGNFVDDGKTCFRVMHVRLKQGGKVLTAGTDFTIKIFKMSGSTRTEVTTATDRCIESIVGNEITFNVQFAENATYQIAAYVGTTEVGVKAYGWVWSSEMPTTDEGIVGGATYCDGDKQSYRPKLNMAGSVIEHPCVAFNLDWYYRKNGLLTYVGSGEVQTYDLTDSSMFSTGSSEGEAVLKISKKGVRKYLAAGSNRYTDGNGNYYFDN